MSTSETLDELKERIITGVLGDLFSPNTPFDRRMEFIHAPVKDLITYHPTLGRDIRNMYNLWTNNLLLVHNIHPDDFSMSCIIAVHERAGIQYKSSLFRLK